MHSPSVGFGPRLGKTLPARAHPPTVDEAARKKTLRMVPYALYLMGVRRATVSDVSKDLNAFVASWVTQVSFKPPMLVVGVKRGTHSNAMLKETRVFTLNVLGSEQKDLAQRFFKELIVTGSEMSGTSYLLGAATGCPVFPETPATIECEVVEENKDFKSPFS